MDTIEEQLKQAILAKYKSVLSFTKEIGIPYSTLDSVFKRGIANSGVSTMLRVFHALDLDIESISTNTLRPKTYADACINKSEYSHIKKYRSLDVHGKEAVDGILNIEYHRCAVTFDEDDTELYANLARQQRQKEKKRDAEASSVNDFAAG